MSGNSKNDVSSQHNVFAAFVHLRLVFYGMYWPILRYSD